MNRRGPISRMIGGGIGFAREYQADRKQRKSPSPSPDPTSSNTNPFDDGNHLTPTPSHQDASGHLALPTESGRRSSQSSDGSDVSEESIDGEEWAQMLDEVGAEHRINANANASASPTSNDPADFIIEDFLAAHPPPPYSKSTPPSGPLSLPVILPQRRPELRHRGFIRAYAPVLADAGIDQAAWLGFLDGFEKSIKANPVFHVLNVGVFIAEHARLAVQGVSIFASLATMALHVSIEAGRRGYTHWRQNGYLDKMNEGFFKPRGCFALVIKYKVANIPAAQGQGQGGVEFEEDVDLESNITHQIAARDDPKRSKWKNLISPASGTTSSDAEIPEFAPLTFPYVDAMGDAEKQNAFKRFGGFVTDYNDRQAQATFEARHPESKLPTAPRKEFASRYSDPNHAASNGGLVSIVSGGKYNLVGPIGRLRRSRGSRRAGATGQAQGGDQAGAGGKQNAAAPRRKRGGLMSKALKQDALYLIVVNMPTEEEMRRVLEAYEGAGSE